MVASRSTIQGFQSLLMVANLSFQLDSFLLHHISCLIETFKNPKGIQQRLSSQSSSEPNEIERSAVVPEKPANTFAYPRSTVKDV